MRAGLPRQERGLPGDNMRKVSEPWHLGFNKPACDAVATDNTVTLFMHFLR